MAFAEVNYENALIELFTEKLGYEHICGYDVERDYASPLFMRDILPLLSRLNPHASAEILESTVRKLTELEGFGLLQKNMCFTKYLQDGMDIPYYEKGEERTCRIRLFDFEHVEKNSFVVANQWTIAYAGFEKRPDMIVFVNGFPLVVIELKSPSREDTDVSEAYRQLKNYQHAIEPLFYYNAFCVMSDQAVSKAGTITANEDRFMEWKTVDGKYENTSFASYETFFEGMFQKERFLDLILNFMCFDENKDGTRKILAAYHQYFAVKKAIQSTVQAIETDGKGGVFWHTQGSGKSLSMVFYAKNIRKAVSSPTLVVVTDRVDLDNQLFLQFAGCQKFLYQSPVQAKSREDLVGLLEKREANGIIFTTMQKFEESDKPLSTRKNIIVIADEAHRSHYGLVEKVGKEGKIKLGSARIIRNGLPCATFIGFTGTPIDKKDRSTVEVFGNYIDMYDMTQAVEDGATKPVFYESRVVSLHLDKDILKRIDEEYDLLAQNADPYAIEKSKRELGKLEEILGAEQTIHSLVTDILEHYCTYREHLLTGKAMIVAYSRPIAMKIYKQILALKPDWKNKIALVMTQGNNDPEEWQAIIGNKNHKTEMAKKFKDDTSEMKIAIVVDMWLTGFDVPSLATMYVYKPMVGHNLMQAIARVNRVYKNKAGGLVVDYVGIAAALKQAMKDYTSRDLKNYGDMDIKKEAYPKFLEKMEICRDLLYGYDYSAFMHGTDRERAKAITGATNFLLDKSLQERDKPENRQTKNLFIKEVLLLIQSLSLCSSIVDEEKRFESAFFEAVRTMLVRFSTGGESKKFSLAEINQRINELLKNTIKSDGIINLFSDVKTEFSLFDPKFLNEIFNMKEKNLALEMLKKLISEKVAVYKKTNLVKSEQFSEIIQNAMNNYFRGLLTNEQVIKELLELAGQIMQAEKEAGELGLSSEEVAFYDALTRPEAVKDFYENEELVNITKELTELLRKKRTVDWQKKESAKAEMRSLVKRLLKKYKYPPAGMEEAIKTVISQCELWVES
ncbi:MAG TPA: type I restriction endonuclease subunit R [Desulfovibrio sp.]|nr:type I restriction endonuclease subunit R [Desulfovibrio sp.]